MDKKTHHSHLYFPQKKDLSLLTCASDDGANFENSGKIKLLDSRGRLLNLQNLSTVRISQMEGQYIATYLMRKGLVNSLQLAVSKNLREFRTTSYLSQIDETAQIVSDYKYQDDYIMYAGGRGIRILTSADLKKWRMDKKPLIIPEFAGSILEIGTVEKIASGIMLFYFQSLKGANETNFYSIGAAIFDNLNPRKLIYQSKEVIWEQPDEWNNINGEIRPFGIVIWEAKLISFWELNKREIVAILHEPKPRVQEEEKSTPLMTLTKIKENDQRGN